MRRDLLAGGERAFADDEDRRQRRHTRAQMHDDAASEINHAPLREEAAAPDPVDEGDVDQQAPEHEEDEVRLEADAVGESAGDQRGGDDGEHQLEEEEGEEGNRGGVGVAGREADVLQAKVVEIADQPPVVAAVGEAEADEDPEDRDDAHRDEALHHDGQDVLVADESAVEEGQARRHEQDERGAEEDEGGVTGVEGSHKRSPLNGSGHTHVMT